VEPYGQSHPCAACAFHEGRFRDSSGDFKDLFDLAKRGLEEAGQDDFHDKQLRPGSKFRMRALQGKMVDRSLLQADKAEPPDSRLPRQHRKCGAPEDMANLCTAQVHNVHRKMDLGENEVPAL